jgi:hypothetical protein
MRSLYQCGNARVRGDKIECACGHSLSARKDGIPTEQLAKGDPLEFKICQDCSDYDHMGNAVRKADRGWL